MRAPTRERLLFVGSALIGRSREYDNARPGTFNRRGLEDCREPVSPGVRLAPVTAPGAKSDTALPGG